MSARLAPRGPRGMALMEALIALLLLSSAALAYAALQMRGLSASNSALWRSKAGVLAYDMADRLRANRAGVAAGSYDSLIATPTAPGCGLLSACSPANMAVLDFVRWRTALDNELPAGVGVVCLDSTPYDGSAAAPACDGNGSLYAVKVFWREKGEDSRVSVGVRP